MNSSGMKDYSLYSRVASALNVHLGKRRDPVGLDVSAEAAVDLTGAEGTPDFLFL
jgi:hypothetical protein